MTSASTVTMIILCVWDSSELYILFIAYPLALGVPVELVSSKSSLKFVLFARVLDLDQVYYESCWFIVFKFFPFIFIVVENLIFLNSLGGIFLASPFWLFDYLNLKIKHARGRVQRVRFGACHTQMGQYVKYFQLKSHTAFFMLVDFEVFTTPVRTLILIGMFGEPIGGAIPDVRWRTVLTSPPDWSSLRRKTLSLLNDLYRPATVEVCKFWYVFCDFFSKISIFKCSK